MGTSLFSCSPSLHKRRSQYVLSDKKRNTETISPSGLALEIAITTASFDVSR